MDNLTDCVEVARAAHHLGVLSKVEHARYGNEDEGERQHWPGNGRARRSSG